MKFFRPTTSSLSLCLCLSLMMVGCASKPTNPTGKTLSTPATYQVKVGDTVSKIAQEYNINWRDISALNNLDANHTIYAGQVLKLPINTSLTAQSANNQILTENKTVTILPATTNTLAPTPNKTATPLAITPTLPEPQAPEFKLPPNPEADKPPILTANEILQFDYPVGKDNRVVKGFGSPLKNGTTEGIFFAGQAGDTIYASGTGTVIYANNAPNHRPMIMIDHGKGYISTYFDVNEVQVKSGSKVNKGDKLGVMIIQTQDGRALFEFRIAKHGRYIDPITILK